MDVFSKFLATEARNSPVPVGVATDFMPQIGYLPNQIGVLIGYPAYNEKGSFYPKLI
jgi:hypothetical protein